MCTVYLLCLSLLWPGFVSIQIMLVFFFVVLQNYNCLVLFHGVALMFYGLTVQTIEANSGVLSPGIEPATFCVRQKW